MRSPHAPSLFRRLANGLSAVAGVRSNYLLRNERDRLRAELAAVTRDRDGYRAAFEQVGGELSQTRYLLRHAVRADHPGRQFVFLHVPRTGGGALAQGFRGWFDYLRTLAVSSPIELDRYDPAVVAHFDWVTGHLTARNLSAVRADAFVCTVLREPAERVVSLYAGLRASNGPVPEALRRAAASAKANTLLGFLWDADPAVRRLVANAQAHTLAGDWFAPDDRPAADLKADAAKALDQFDYVGLADHLAAAADDIARLTGRPHPGAPLRLHAAADRPALAALKAAELDRLAELTAVDAHVYQLARAKFAARPTTAAPVAVPA